MDGCNLFSSYVCVKIQLTKCPHMSFNQNWITCNNLFAFNNFYFITQMLVNQKMLVFQLGPFIDDEHEGIAVSKVLSLFPHLLFY